MQNAAKRQPTVCTDTPTPDPAPSTPQNVRSTRKSPLSTQRKSNSTVS